MPATYPLIVIVGLPRSGTTWIAKIFDSHPITVYRHEPDTVSRFAIPFAPDADSASPAADVARHFASRLLEFRDSTTAGKRPFFRKAYHVPLGRPRRMLAANLARLASRASIPFVIPDCARPGAPFVLVWKSINSTARLGLLARALPHAYFLHVVRHPCAYAASIFRGESQRRFTSATSPWDDQGIFDELAGTAIGRRYALASPLAALSPAQRLAWLWAVQNEKALEETETLPNVSHLRYEDACDAPVAVSRAAFEQAALPWSTVTEDFILRSTQTESSAYYAVFKNPQRAANAWRSDLPDSMVKDILNMLRATRAWRWYEGGAQYTEKAPNRLIPSLNHPQRNDLAA